MEKSMEDIARENPSEAKEFLGKFVDFLNRYHWVEPVQKDLICRFLQEIS